MMISHNRSELRAGFTMLELLMVVALIAFLTTLSVVVMYGITDQANEEATNATIRKINGLLEKRIEGFNKAIGRDGDFKGRYITAARNLLIQDKIFGPLINNPVVGEGDGAIVEALARKVAFRHLFPQRHEDLLLLDFATDGITSETDFTSAGNIEPTVADRVFDTNGNRISDKVEATATDSSLLPSADTWVRDSTVSAELLYYFLVHSDSLGASDSVTDLFTTAEIADTDSDGLPEFIDAWGNPLRFYRWPTRMIDVDPPSPFQPVLSNVSEATDVAPVGPRTITTNERLVANIMFRGLPPEPTGLPNGSLPRDLLLIDPDDPVGVLYRGLEQYTGGAVDLNGDGDTGDPGENDTGVPLRTEFNETNYHTPDTYHAPIIVSAGADEELGLFEPSDTPNFGNLAAYDSTVSFAEMLERVGDNLTNRNRRSGGR